MKSYFMYILECSDGTFYTGITSNLEIRLEEYLVGAHEGSYTYHRRLVELKWYEQFANAKQAIKVEKQIKGWSRGKKIALINSEWDKLILYSKNYTQFGKGE